MVEITVYGLAAPQGSKRFMGMKGGRGVMIESSARVKPWREAVKNAALDKRAAMKCVGMETTICGPVLVEMIFTLPKPKSAPRGRRTWPDRKPDLSKLVRSTEDAITDVLLWEDDARVVQCLSMKVFPGEHQDALEMPGALIRISRAGI